MANFNRVLLLGNLTRDPQMKMLPSQMAVTEFGMAMNRKYRTGAGEDREEVCFVDVTAFGKQAEIINQYCQKGKQLLVEGRLKLDQWDDKNGGGKRSKLTVVVENFQLLGGRDGAPAAGGGGYDSGAQTGGEYDQRPPARSAAPAARPPAQRPPAQRPAPQQPPAEQPFGDEPQIDEADIPF